MFILYYVLYPLHTYKSLSMPMPVYGSFTCSTKKLISSDSISLALIVLQILQSPSRHTNCRVQTYCLKKWRRQIFLLRLVDNWYNVVGWNKIPLKWGWLTPLCCWEGLVIFGHELSVICYRYMYVYRYLILGHVITISTRLASEQHSILMYFSKKKPS